MKCVVGEKELCYTFRQEASCYKVDTLPDLQTKGGDADGYIPDPGVIVLGGSFLIALLTYIDRNNKRK